jgi:hypothetical protein
MSSASIQVAESNHPRLTLASGGWVLLVAAAVCAALIGWALAPALLFQRPPGDGRTIESYGFDVGNLLVQRELIAPAMRYRDMVPIMHEPRILTAAEALRINEVERGKYLVSTDRVVGVVIDGEPRAYPIALLNVHEIIHDELAGVPIAVTYNWLGDAARVFDRRVTGNVINFGVSGLVYNANLLMYDVRADDEIGGESLWSQLLGRAVSGPAADAGLALHAIPAQLVSWSHWLDLHPDTTVVARDPGLMRRYRRSSPDEYFNSPEIPYPVASLPEGKAKERAIVVRVDGAERMYPLSEIAQRSQPPDDPREAARRRSFMDEVGGVRIRFVYEPVTNTAMVQADAPIDFFHCFRFAWLAMEDATN